MNTDWEERKKIKKYYAFLIFRFMFFHMKV